VYIDVSESDEGNYEDPRDAMMHDIVGEGAE
jgi:hypothetical protein